MYPAKKKKNNGYFTEYLKLGVVASFEETYDTILNKFK